MLGDLSIPRLSALGALIFLAGFVDAIAGGGGLISLPAYLAAGLNPIFLLGTNKLSSSIGTAVSTARYLRNGKFPLGPFVPVICAALLASAAGARLALHLRPEFIRYLLLAALPVVALTVLTRKKFGHEDRTGQWSAAELAARSSVVALPIGCYDGFFGPGTGTFFAVAFSRFCGYDLVKATTGAKILNLATNIAALTTFLAAGKVNLRLGVSMGLLSLAGNYAGASLVIKRGPQAIRPMIALVCAGLFIKILADTLR